MKRSTSLLGLLAWSVGGAALGLAAGIVMNETVGEVAPARIRRLVSRRRAPARPARTGQLARQVRAALATDVALASFTLEALAVSARTVELHGWVTTRPLRAHAARVARRVPELDTVINCILVHGEDDVTPPEETTASA